MSLTTIAILFVAMLAIVAAALFLIPYIKAAPERAAIGPVSDGQRAENWLLGPFVDGENRTKGMPLHPAPHPDGIFEFDFPIAAGDGVGSGMAAAGHVHYVTFRLHGSLEGARGLRMRYRVEADPEAVIVPRTDPRLPSLLTMYFAHKKNDWSGEGKDETRRWYAGFATQMPIQPGEFEVITPLDSRWTSVFSSNSHDSRAEFHDAVVNTGQVGFVLGGGDGLGHGVYATDPAKFILLEFEVMR